MNDATTATPESTTMVRRTIDQMPARARVWMYKVGRDLSLAEQELVRKRGDAFTATWKAHEAKLDAMVDVLHHRFVIVSVDEEQALASGCSIDESVAFIKQLELDLNVTLTDRMIVVYEDRDGITSCHLDQVPEFIASGKFTADTLVYDSLVPTIGELRSRFRVRLADHWLARYL